MKNRAFYSEPLQTIPGRLHITEDRVYIEIIITIEGHRKFQTFERDDILNIGHFLRCIGYFEGNTNKYENVVEELSNIDWRVNGLQKTIFHSLHSRSTKTEHLSPENNTNKDYSYPEEDRLNDEFNQDFECNYDIFDEGINEPIEEPIRTPWPQDDFEIQSEEPIYGSFTELSEESEEEEDIEYVNNVEDDAIVRVDQENPIREDSSEEKFESKQESDETDSSSSYSFGNTDVPKEISSYASMFINLSDSAGCNATDKSLILMSLISLFEDEKRMYNRILCNENFIQIYESKYKSYLSQTLENPKIRVREIFRSMSNEPFWEEIEGVYTPSGIVSDIAEIDKELAEFLRQMKYRKVLKKLLYHRYFAKK